MQDQPLIAGNPTDALFLGSNLLSGVAFKAAGRAPNDPDASLVALLFSAAWFEASLNEAIEDVLREGLPQQAPRRGRVRLAIQAAGADQRHTSIERRIRVICVAATEAALDAETEPWRSVLLLFRLRNWLVHLRPERLSVRVGRDDEPSSLVSTSVHELVVELQRVGAFGEVPQGTIVPVTTAIQLPGVARWAYRAAYAGVEGLDVWLPQRFRPLIDAHRPSSQVAGGGAENRATSDAHPGFGH